MSKIKRQAFLKMGALAVLTPFSSDFLLHAAPLNNGNGFFMKEELLKKIVIANDNQVGQLLQTTRAESIGFSRRLGYDFSALAAAYVSPDSNYFHSQAIVTRLELLNQVLQSFQTADGTVNIANQESPPDTAFLIELLSAGAHILIKDQSPELAKVNREIKKFLLLSGEALAIGGVHTPNHRWVICSALARLNDLYPNKKYIDRIEDWLGEGIFIDSDGHYPERSRLYAGVENNSLLTMGRFLNKPALFEPVRKNLATTYFYLEPNGDLVTTDSRRQDQYSSKTIVSYYYYYRYLAIKDNNSYFAGVAKLIEQMKSFEEEIINRGLFHFLENPVLQQALPLATPPSDNFEKLFTAANLLRIRRGGTSSTLFGGADWPIIIASGRSNSPNLFSYRKGNAILKYMRLSTSFFSMGYFYSEGLKKENNKYVLHKKLAIPYYQPLAKELRKSDGDYKLSPSIDDRFWNKMDFANRPVSNVKTMETTVSLLETNGKNELEFKVSGLAGVAVTIELCFFEGGNLTGVTAAGDENGFLEKGYGTYEFGGDTIRFGPGALAHKSINNLEGERYSTHFGSLRTTGKHVFITGITPFNHTLTFS